ncbi:TetR/AcrR family transcriptional regulator, partial [Streptomyces sp. SID11233]|nr:TetR/AcrR family transcriptional regulator [Streptomyces sp. SID11233]
RVLYADLDRLRADWIAETEAVGPLPESWQGATTALAEHVLRYEAVYTAGLVGQRSPVLQQLLVEHLRTSVRVYVARDPEVLPAG